MSARHTVCLAVVALLLGVPSAAFTQELRQERLFALVQEHPGAATRKFVEIDTRADTFGQVLRAWPGVEPATNFDGALYALAGGRYVVWNSGFLPRWLPVVPVRLNVFDTQLASIRVIENAIYGPIVAVDSNRERIFLAEPQRIAIVDARTGTISYMNRPAGEPAYQTQPPPAAYAGGADRLFMRRDQDLTSVDVFDVASGNIVQTISTGANWVFGLATDPSAARLFTMEGAFVSSHDTATSTLIARVPLQSRDTVWDSTLQFDEQRGRLMVGALVVFDADTLDRLGEAQGACTGDPDCRSRGPAFTFFGPRSPLLFFTSRTYIDFQARTVGCAFAPLERRDPDTGQPQRMADLAPLATAGEYPNPRCSMAMVMTSVPAAPRAFTSQVQGRQVTLSWGDPGNTTHFDVEAGSAPGLRNLYQQGIGGTTVTVDNVPPGTYYVRVRAINYVGRSLPAEITVVVQ